ncbi:Selenium-binding protein 2 [Raphanus sativus]|nr:Selenium-binding protein 2 [Raphanus sativus]
MRPPGTKSLPDISRLTLEPKKESNLVQHNNHSGPSRGKGYGRGRDTFKTHGRGRGRSTTPGFSRGRDGNRDCIGDGGEQRRRKSLLQVRSGYATPLAAMSGPPEKLIYVTALYSGTGREQPDYLATVDVTQTHPHIQASCHGDPSASRRYLVLPGLISGRIYAIDTMTDPKAPSLYKVVEPKEISEKTGLAFPHTSHCLASGDMLVSCLGDNEGNAEGNGFLLLDSDFNVKAAFSKGFDLQHVADGLYGSHLHIYKWPEGEMKQVIDLGDTGLLPLEIRFLHDPSKDTGYVGSALSSNMIRFFRNSDDTWSHEVVISVEPLKVENWILPEMPGLITDFLISLDDRFFYFVNWLHGDIRQYNIEDPKNPVLTGQIWVGGLLQKGSPVKGVREDGTTYQFDVPQIKMHSFGSILAFLLFSKLLFNILVFVGKSLRAGPQMIQLSLDGKRLYATNSLFSAWDRQFYPEVMDKGSHIIQIDVDTEKGGLAINPDFFVDFGVEPDGPALAHEMRYPGGDCTSDIWI